MNIEKIKGIGPKTAEVLHEKGIYTSEDLIKYIPRSYDCYEVGKVDPFSGEKATALAIINSAVVSKKIKYTDCLIFSAIIDNKATKVLLFGQGFLRFKLKKGSKVIISGYYKFDNKSFLASDVFFDLFSVKIEPSYKFKDLADTSFRRYVGLALSENNTYEETLPIEYCQKYRLYEDETFYYNAHFPKDKEVLLQVERRKKY